MMICDEIDFMANEFYNAAGWNPWIKALRADRRWLWIGIACPSQHENTLNGKPLAIERSNWMHKEHMKGYPSHFLPSGVLVVWDCSHRILTQKRRMTQKVSTCASPVLEGRCIRELGLQFKKSPTCVSYLTQWKIKNHTGPSSERRTRATVYSWIMFPFKRVSQLIITNHIGPHQPPLQKEGSIICSMYQTFL